MKKFVAIAIALLVLALTPLATPPASADLLDVALGAAFLVGGLTFSVALGDYYGHHAYYDYYDYGAPFFYVAKKLAYSGYKCGDYCYRKGGGYYHHYSCPLVRHHFHRHGHRIDDLIYRYGPHSKYYHYPRGHKRYGYGYDDYRYRYRYDRGYRHYDRGHRSKYRHDHRYRDDRGRYGRDRHRVDRDRSRHDDRHHYDRGNHGRDRHRVDRQRSRHGRRVPGYDHRGSRSRERSYDRIGRSRRESQAGRHDRSSRSRRDDVRHRRRAERKD